MPFPRPAAEFMARQAGRLQGIATPASLIPRACSVEDAANTAILTAVRAEGPRVSA
ncbi:MAG: hypothetical protein ABSD27_14335 [Bryobacteraceae bacterium]|jgi:phosphotransacetylase